MVVEVGIGSIVVSGRTDGSLGVVCYMDVSGAGWSTIVVGDRYTAGNDVYGGNPPKWTVLKPDGNTCRTS